MNEENVDFCFFFGKTIPLLFDTNPKRSRESISSITYSISHKRPSSRSSLASYPEDRQVDAGLFPVHTRRIVHRIQLASHIELKANLTKINHIFITEVNGTRF